MRSLFWVMVVVAGSACTRVPVFEVGDARTCERDVFALGDGLAAHVIASDDGGATFDYTPDAPLQARVEGRYDLESGAFRWTRTYVDGHWRVEEIVMEGQGTVYTDGDLDVAYDRQLVTIAGGQRVQSVREVRLGCEVDRAVRDRDGDLISVETGTFGEDGYAFTIEREERGVQVLNEGLWAWDGTRTDAEAWRSGDYQYEHERTDDGAGTVVRSFRILDAGAASEGEVVQDVEGGEVWDFERVQFNATEHWTYEVDFFGTGEGEVEIEQIGRQPIECEVTFDEGDCTLSCPDRGREEC